MPPLPEAIRRVLAPFAPLFADHVWRPAHVLWLGASLTPGPRTVTAALRVMGLGMERHFTHDHRVLNRASWSARQGSRILLGWLITGGVPPGATLGLGADDTGARRGGRKIAAKGGYRDAGRSTKKPGIRGVGLQWGSMRLLGPVPWSRRLGAPPFRTALCWPAEPSTRRRHKTSVDWVRHMMKQVRRWWPGRRLGFVVEGGVAAGSLALAWGKSHVVLVARVRWDAARYHPPGPQPPGKRGPQPTQGQRPRRLQAWAERSDTPGETVEVLWYGGQLKHLWVFSRTALWSTPRLPPVAFRAVLVAEPEGMRRMEAFFCTDLEATPVEVLPWVVMRGSVEGTCEEARAHLGVETQRQWSDQAIARTTPVLLGLFALVTLLALRLSQNDPIPVPVTAWSHKEAPPFSDCLTLVRGHRWRARYVVNAAPEAELRHFPAELLDLLIHDVPLAA
jgi:hypothetical protein